MDHRKRYRVANGVAHVAGAPVPEDRIVRLTDAEALYDKALGRLLPQKTNPVPPAEPVAMDEA